MPRYIVPHHGGLKYVRAIPKDVQPLEGRKVWTAYLKGLSAEDAKTRALELAAEHDKRAKALRNLAEADKRLLKSKGGLARCQADAGQADYLAAVLWSYSIGSRRPTPAHRTIAALLRGARPDAYHRRQAQRQDGRRPPTVRFGGALAGHRQAARGEVHR